MPIQILIWLMQPKVWRFVCLISSVVGLFFYALSSSFNHLFGKWNLWKILLYTVFSFIICLAMFFTKVWQHSASLRLKAQLAFLVLFITSVYSFFFDKVLNGKPDAYSLISCASFAIMSLGLSRQTHCGFEVDLLYFFSGCLIVQLMTIKLYLVLVGAGFSYSLIILRSYMDVPLESGHLSLQVQDQVVIEVYSPSPEKSTGSAVQVNSPQVSAGDGNANLVMPLVAKANSASEAPPVNKDLRILATQVDSTSQQGDKDHSDHIMPRFMACIEALKKENGNLIHTVSKHVKRYLKADAASDSEDDDNLVVDTLPSGIIKNLHKMVELMVATGLKEDCCHIYSCCRREFLEEWLSAFGLQELSMEDADSKMAKIESWIKAFNIAVKILLPNEKRLFHCIFKGFSAAADMSFTEVSKELIVHLLSFADTLATRRHSPNFLSAIIPKVVKTLHNLFPQFQALLPNQSSVSSLSHVFMVWNILPMKIGINNLICYDMAQPPTTDGGIQHITLKVLSYLGRISKRVIQGRDISRRKIMSCTLSYHLASLMIMLESNLEAKSGNYSDPALGCVFMMNNYKCIELGANVIGLGTIFGDDWFQKNTAKVQQNLELYQRNSWNKLLDFLKLDSLELELPNVAAESIKVKLELFNLHFEEICNTQSTWPVFDKQLRKQIIVSIENILLPAYGSFICKTHNILGKHGEDYIKYGMFQIQERLNHLFLVSPMNQLLDMGLILEKK